MNPPSQDPLNRLLQRWAERDTPGGADQLLLRAQIHRALEQGHVDAPAAQQRALRQQRVSRAACFAMGFAAALLLAVAAFYWRTPEKAPAPAPTSRLLTHEQLQHAPLAEREDHPGVSALLTDQRLRHQAILLDEIETVFDRRVIWLAEHGDGVEIGVAGDRGPSEATAVTVRIVVERRRQGDRQWSIAWSGDVVLRSEEVARLGGDSSGAELAMWAFVLPDGMIAIDADLSLSPGVRISSSSVQQHRQATRTSTLERDGFEFRMHQTAAILEPV